MSCPLSACIDAEECNALAKLAVNIAAALFNVGSGTVSDDKAWILCLTLSV